MPKGTYILSKILGTLVPGPKGHSGGQGTETGFPRSQQGQWPHACQGCGDSAVQSAWSGPAQPTGPGHIHSGQLQLVY